MAETVKQYATSAAPVACPIRREVATTPLAPPARSGGALPMMAFRFGAWKKPKPTPHTAMRQPMSKALGCAGIHTSVSKPAARAARPMPPSMPGE